MKRNEAYRLGFYLGVILVSYYERQRYLKRLISIRQAIREDAEKIIQAEVDLEFSNIVEHFDD